MSTGRLSDGGSEASILSSDDALKPPPIDNSMLCVTDHSGTKRLPSLTDEGITYSQYIGVFLVFFNLGGGEALEHFAPS